MVLNSILLTITEEVYECAGRASTQIEKSSYSDKRSLRELRNKGKERAVNQKMWLWLFRRALDYRFK